jgi:hypothetical protein
LPLGAPFQQWGLDFIGEINPTSSGQHRWILTATYHFTKWIKVVPIRQVTDVVIVDFLINNILSRFGCPRKIVTYKAKDFTSNKLDKFCSDYNIILSHSTAYYPQGNGLAESSNKSLVRIIKKLTLQRKDCTYFLFLGISIFWMASTLLGSIFIPSSEIT